MDSTLSNGLIEALNLAPEVHDLLIRGCALLQQPAEGQLARVDAQPIHDVLTHDLLIEIGAGDDTPPRPGAGPAMNAGILIRSPRCPPLT
jgi:hypothetical protein